MIKSAPVIILLFILSLFSSIDAQDTIVKKNEEKIIGKILEVNPGDIKFKRFDYQDGPTFTLDKSELKFVVYHNGIRESYEAYKSPVLTSNSGPAKKDLSIQPSGKLYYYQGQAIAEQDMLDVAWKLQDKKVKIFVSKTEENKVIKNSFLAVGIAVGAAAGILTAIGAFSPDNVATMGTAARAARRAASIQHRTTGGYLLLGAITCEVVSFTFHIKEKRHAHMVVDLYNQVVTSNR